MLRFSWEGIHWFYADYSEQNSEQRILIDSEQGFKYFRLNFILFLKLWGNVEGLAFLGRTRKLQIIIFLGYSKSTVRLQKRSIPQLQQSTHKLVA